MKTNIKFLLIVAFAFLIFSCNKTNDNATPPVLTTTAISAITGTTAMSGGTISNDGGEAVTARGVCWSTTPNPTVSNSKTTDGTGIGTFSSAITGLNTNTTYYIRAYATNSAGTSYGNQLSLATTFVCGGNITDIDGNVYETVSIGSQCWMKENLKTSKYNDGANIPTGLSIADWISTTNGAYTMYNNNPINDTIYGKLYNWHAVNTGKLAPAGWHVPTNEEWQTLTNYLGVNPGNKMKDTTLWVHYLGITNTNSSGFTARPAGIRDENGTYINKGQTASFWTSTEHVYARHALHVLLGYNVSGTGTFWDKDEKGFSVRCIKN